jgi:hypothetical protein
MESPKRDDVDARCLCETTLKENELRRFVKNENNFQATISFEMCEASDISCLFAFQMLAFSIGKQKIAFMFLLGVNYHFCTWTDTDHYEIEALDFVSGEQVWLFELPNVDWEWLMGSVDALIDISAVQGVKTCRIVDEIQGEVWRISQRFEDRCFKRRQS